MRHIGRLILVAAAIGALSGFGFALIARAVENGWGPLCCGVAAAALTTPIVRRWEVHKGERWPKGYEEIGYVVDDDKRPR
jgi:hypothetical protein